MSRLNDKSHCKRKLIAASAALLLLSTVNEAVARSLLWGEALDAIRCSTAARALGDDERSTQWAEHAYQLYSELVGELDDDVPKFVTKDLVVGMHMGTAEQTVRYSVYPSRTGVYRVMSERNRSGDAAFSEIEAELIDSFASRTFQNFDCGKSPLSN